MKLKKFLDLLKEDEVIPEADLRIGLTTCCDNEYLNITDIDIIDNDLVQIEGALGSCMALGNKERCKNKPVLEKILEKLVDYKTLAELITCEDQEVRDYVTDWAKRCRK